MQNSLDLVLRVSGGRIAVPMKVTAQILGIAFTTARCQLHNGQFPVTTFLQGRNRYAHAADIANYLDGLRAGGAV